MSMTFEEAVENSEITIVVPNDYIARSLKRKHPNGHFKSVNSQMWDGLRGLYIDSSITNDKKLIELTALCHLYGIHFGVIPYEYD